MTQKHGDIALLDRRTFQKKWLRVSWVEQHWEHWAQCLALQPDSLENLQSPAAN